jgi:hypothetical protein
MNKTFGFFRGGNVGTPASPRVTPTFSVAVSYSGKSNFFSYDYNIINYAITSNIPNATVYYTLEDLQGNLQADDFTDNTLSGNVTLDANGSATITKTLIKNSGIGEGHKKFNLALRRDSITGPTLTQSGNTQVYEIIPITATGGNITSVPYTATGFDGVYGSRIHSFSNAATETFTISNYGNYTGNANVWIDQFASNSSFTVGNQTFDPRGYWISHPLTQEKGLRFRNTIIGGGGAGQTGGGGAGEIGFWTLPLGNIAAGSYSIKVGKGLTTTNTGVTSNAANTIAFVGNANLQINAVGGGLGDLFGSGLSIGSPGGCGGGGVSGGLTAASLGISELAAKTTIYFPKVSGPDSSPTMGQGGDQVSAAGGGGGVTQKGQIRNGGQGIAANSFPYYGDFIYFDSQFIPNGTPNAYGGGGGGSGGGTGGFGGGAAGQPGVKGTGGGGGNNQNGGEGLVAIRYPYATAYRFVTGNVLI